MDNIKDKIKRSGIDLFVLVMDKDRNMYMAEPYRAHADYDSYRLVFSFEDWGGIIGDGLEHIYITAEYRNANDEVIVKFQDEDFDRLLLKVGEWCCNHRNAG